MVHMMTYQRSFVSRYSRISSILETDTIMAQHAHRGVSHRSHEVTQRSQRGLVSRHWSATQRGQCQVTQRSQREVSLW